jgi:hypothetical protein
MSRCSTMPVTVMLGVRNYEASIGSVIESIVRERTATGT